jgi:hypothetical protein
VSDGNMTTGNPFRERQGQITVDHPERTDRRTLWIFGAGLEFVGADHAAGGRK